MNWIQAVLRQPVTVVVGVLLVLLTGFVGIQRIPVQLTPNVEDTIIAVRTNWEGASPLEIEQEIIDRQEEKLQGLANLRTMTSTSLQGTGTVRLEFAVGTSKEAALREVSDKLREVPRYPENADEPVVEASDPENRDYIAWIVLTSTDPTLDIRTLKDFTEDRIQPALERVAGISEVNVLGGREREVQIRFDPALLAQRGITVTQLVDAVQRTNRNLSGGAVAEDKSDVRLRMVSQYSTLAQVEGTVVAETDGGPVLVRDVADVVYDYKEATTFVRSRGVPVVAINAQKEIGANVLEVMRALQVEVRRMNDPGGVLEAQARSMGLNGGLALTQVYDQTVYIDDALLLVRNNIWLGGGLAMLVLLLFLRSFRTAGIVAMAIPISIIGAMAAMVTMGRTINVISLAGMAFAVGMVVDNAIVVLENIYRHLEMGKPPMQAAYDGTREVLGAVVAATLTTVVVFVPILLIQDEAGQLFRDIALAIVAAVALSLVVSITVIPTAAARILRARPAALEERNGDPAGKAAPRGRLAWIGNLVRSLPQFMRALTYRVGGSVSACLLLVFVLTGVSVAGTYFLLPPSDYLPTGNRNLIFGLLIPPPGYNLEQKEELSRRIEETIRPYWEVGRLEKGSDEYERGVRELPSVPTFDFATMSPGAPVVPPPLENYFLVSIAGSMFHGGISSEPDRAVDYLPLFSHAARADVAPGVLAFAFQVPLFRLGGTTGSAVKINFAGDDLDQVSSAALAVYGEMVQTYGPFSTQPDPSNFNISGPELQVVPDQLRLSELGIKASDLGLAVQALGDGAIIGEYRIGGQTIDLKLTGSEGRDRTGLAELADVPIATPAGRIVSMGSVADFRRVNSAPQINRTGRQRAVTLQFTPPPAMPLESAVDQIEAMLERHRASGTIPPSVACNFTGSASKLEAVKTAMLGDGSGMGTLTSALVLALLVVYLLMCVLFQSFVQPLIILFSVPLATLGGFAALFAVFLWSTRDPYMPVQSLDVLTMLGFVILIGVVVNNAILIVHQSHNFMRDGREPRDAIADAVESRVRPIFMGTLTSVGGMAPLVLMPGSGSELYRGLGSVVVGGLLLSTVFTLLLVPALLNLATRFQSRPGADELFVEEDTSLSRRGLSSSLLVLLALGLFLGCAPLWRESESLADAVDRLVEDRLQSQTESLDPGGPEPVRVDPAGAPSELDPEIESRLDELESLGGLQSFDLDDLPLPEDLLGATSKVQPIELESAVGSATENNLGLRFSRIQPGIDDEGLTIAEADFDSILFSSLEYDDTKTPNRVPILNGIILGSPESSSDRQFLEAGLRRRVSSGAVFSATTFAERFDDTTDGISFAPDPAYRGGVGIGVTQPLLRGFGSEVNRSEIEFARFRLESSEQGVRGELLAVIAATEFAYWDMVEAWLTLAVQNRLTRQGEEVERVLSERRSFDANPAEISDALATVEQRRANLVRIQRLVTATSDRLKVLANDPAYPLGSEALLFPGGDLTAEPLSFRLREAVLTAIEERPEVEQALLAIEDRELRQRVAANGKKPLLDLTAGVTLSGLNDELDDAYGDVFDEDYHDAFVGLSFELPIGNRAATAEERRARLEQSAALIVYEDVVQSILLEVKAALRDVQTSYELIGRTRSFRLAQTENLRALLLEEERRSSLTPEFLNLKFQRQERLAVAQVSEVQALADYRRALAAYNRALGLGFDARRVVVDGKR